MSDDKDGSVGNYRTGGWLAKELEALPRCPTCSSTNLRVNFEEHYTVCDSCGMIILAIPRYPF
jgi:hypothetical protein